MATSLMKSQRPLKYVFVTGGVVSGLGKGITASSIGLLLKAAGWRVTAIKIDPYLNTDAGTMSPFEHGEVFVLDDGGEVDLDLGNYERFLDITLTRDNNITTGKIYNQVIQRERKGDYLGKTVQVVPHVTDAIQDWLERVAHVAVDGQDGPPDVCVVELGGTVGDIESMPFVEAIRQFQFRPSVGPSNFFLVHVSLIPVIGAVGEQKTKPTQHTVQTLRSLGLMPDMLACRSAHPLEPGTKDKLALFCHVPPAYIINIHDVPNVWHVPMLLRTQNVGESVMRKLGLDVRPYLPMLEQWHQRAQLWDVLSDRVTVVMVGKYTGLADSYLSVTKALQHACVAAARRLQLLWIEASDLEPAAEASRPDQHKAAWHALETADGVLVPGGFGERGVEGKILAAKYAREKSKPYLGICLGLQIAVIEIARNVLGLDRANSTEFDPATPHPAVVFMPEGSVTHLGGTLRLGTRRTLLQTVDCITAKLYQTMEHVDERHRHRYEVNPEMVPALEAKGARFVGRDDTGRRMEILELQGHPYFVATQYHPEFKSRPGKPAPVFLGFVLAASGQLSTYVTASSPRSLDVSPGKFPPAKGEPGKGHAPVRQPQFN